MNTKQALATNLPPKIPVRFRVSYVRKAPANDAGKPGDPVELPVQEFFFCVDRASMIRYASLLLWDQSVDSLYVDEFTGAVVADKVKL